MGSCRFQYNDEFLSYSTPIVHWHQINSVKIVDPFNLVHLHLLFSRTINLRTLTLDCDLYSGSEGDSKEKSLIDLLNDAPLCNMLMANGLRQINILIDCEEINLIDIAHLIVERLSHLQILELDCSGSQVLEMLHILMKGLSKLNFLIIHGDWLCDNRRNMVLRDPKKFITRPYRTEIYDSITDVRVLYIWL
jgi:hypothetical protein